MLKLILKGTVGLLLMVAAQAFADYPIKTVNLADKPVGFILSKDESKAYVALGDPIRESSGEIDVIDLHSLKVTGKIKVPGCPWPYLFLSQNNQQLYLIYHNTIAIADLHLNKITHEITLPKNHSIQPGAVISPDQSKIYYDIRTQWTNDNNYLLVIDTETGNAIDKIDNKQATTDEQNVQTNVASMLMQADGKSILEIPQPFEDKKQRLISLDVKNKKSDLLGYLPATSTLGNYSSVITQEGDTLYNVEYEAPNPGQPVSTFHLYSIDTKTMHTKEVYFSESAIGIVGLSEANHRLYVLHVAWDHQRMAVIDTQSGYIIKNNIAIPSRDIKLSSKPASSDVYFTTGATTGLVTGTFNIMTVR